jgi:hypothetical protein
VAADETGAADDQDAGGRHAPSVRAWSGA